VKTTPALADGPNAPGALVAPRTMSERAKKPAAATGRDKEAQALSAKIQQLVDDYEIEGQDSVSPKLMGLLDAVEELVPQLNEAICTDHVTLKVSTKLGVASHLLLMQSQEALMKFQKKSLKKDDKDERMKQICTRYVVDDDGTLKEFIDLPKRRGPRKSTARKAKQPESTDYKKNKLERELNELIEDIGLDNDDNYMMIDVTYAVAAVAQTGAKTLKDSLNNFQYLIDDAQTCYDEALNSLRVAKKNFNSSYLSKNNLEDLPDSEEATYDAYLNEQAKAVKSQSKNFKDWKKSLNDAQKSFTETENELKKKLEAFKTKRVEWQKLVQPIAYDEA
jgi:hypothetical protein